MIEGVVRMSIVFDDGAARWVAGPLAKTGVADNAMPEPVTSAIGSIPVATVKIRLIMVTYPFVL